MKDNNSKTIIAVKIKGGPQLKEAFMFLKILFVFMIFFVIVGLVQYSLCKIEDPKMGIGKCMRAERIFIFNP